MAYDEVVIKMFLDLFMHRSGITERRCSAVWCSCIAAHARSAMKASVS
jgi:hypothetical protein